jgi:hypothetical protein
MGILRGLLAYAVLRPTLTVANAAYMHLWHNRTWKGKAASVAFALVATGLVLDQRDRAANAPPDPQAIVTPDHSFRPDADQLNPAPRIEVPMTPDGQLPAPTPAIVAQTYVELVYDPLTRKYLDSLPAAERAAKAAEVAQNRATLLDAIAKYEAVEITDAMIAEIQRRQNEEMRALYPGKPEQFYIDMQSSAQALAVSVRMKLFLERHPQFRVTAEQAAALDERMGLAPGSSVNADVISALTDTSAARAMGLRSYFIDRESVLELAAQRLVITVPQQRSDVRGLPVAAPG